MHLTGNQIADLESIRQGTVAEVRLTEMGFIVTKRPEAECDLEFPTPVLCSEEPCELIVLLKKDLRVHLLSQELPANYYLKGIRGYRG